MKHTGQSSNENPHSRFNLFIRQTAHQETLLHCSHAAREHLFRRSRPTMRQLGLHLCCNTAAFHWHLKLIVFQSKIPPFQKTAIFRFNSQQHICSKALLFEAFTRLFWKQDSMGHSAVVSLQKHELDPIYTSAGLQLQETSSSDSSLAAYQSLSVLTWSPSMV